MSNWCKRVGFRWGEDIWYINVYEYDWEWVDVPVNSSVRMEQAAHECALENGMCIKATKEVLNDIRS